ncbi:hypothetical protein BH09VER1_BH09VER1_08590 [soil metagenome]
MNTPQGGNRPASAQRKKLPVNPSLEHLQKQAKRRVKQTSSLQLAAAQHQLALEYGCRNWAELARIVETMSRGADQLVNVKREFEALPKAARAVDMPHIRAILASGSFTQHDLDQALAHSLWYSEHGTWEDRKEMADLLIAHGADPDGQYGGNYGPIVFGTGECLNSDGLKYLIDAGADVTFPPVQTKYGAQCPLSYVLGTYSRGANERKHRMVDLLLQHGAYLSPEITPPILAIHRGDAAQLANFLDQDEDLLTRRFPDMPYGNIELRGATLLHCAVEFGEIECLEELFKRYADINMKADLIDGIGGQTPVFHAINTPGDGNFSTLEYLMRRVGPWIDMSLKATWRNFMATQTSPMTPLEYAESAAKTESAKWRKMIDRELVILRSLDHAEQLKTAILREDEGEVTRLLDVHPDLLAPTLWPLAIFQAKSLAITRLLLDRSLNPDECSAPRKPLHLAVYQCLPDIVDLLLERGADATLLNPLGERPLDLLDAYEPRPVGDPDARRIRKALLAAGSLDDLFTVIRAGEVEPLREMLEADPSLAQVDSELGGPLFVAARSGRVEMAKLLLEAGADPNKVNSKGNTPLWFAAQSPARPVSDRIAVMKLLLDAGADLHRRCENGSTALHFAAWRGPVEVVEFLLANGARGWVPDDRGKTPRYDAEERSVAPDKEAIVKRLSQPLIKDVNFRTAVEAMSAGNLEELQRLLRDYPYLATAQAEENGEFAGPYFSRPYLLEFVAENPIRTRRLPANICAIAQAVIDAGSPAIALDNTLGLAASGCVPRECGVQTELLELLVKNGANPSEGLDGAISQGEKEAAETMLRLGAGPGLAAAAGLGHRQRVSELIRKASQKEKENALSVAFRYAQIATAEIILDSGIELGREMMDFGTPLHHAAFYGHLELCDWLLKRGADPTIRDSQWEGTPAGWAHYNKHPELSEFLKEAESRRA